MSSPAATLQRQRAAALGLASQARQRDEARRRFALAEAARPATQRPLGTPHVHTDGRVAVTVPDPEGMRLRLVDRLNREHTLDLRIGDAQALAVTLAQVTAAQTRTPLLDELLAERDALDAAIAALAATEALAA